MSMCILNERSAKITVLILFFQIFHPVKSGKILFYPFAFVNSTQKLFYNGISGCLFKVNIHGITSFFQRVLTK